MIDNIIRHKRARFCYRTIRFHIISQSFIGGIWQRENVVRSMKLLSINKFGEKSSKTQGLFLYSKDLAYLPSLYHFIPANELHFTGELHTSSLRGSRKEWREGTTLSWRGGFLGRWTDNRMRNVFFPSRGVFYDAFSKGYKVCRSEGKRKINCASSLKNNISLLERDVTSINVS